MGKWAQLNLKKLFSQISTIYTSLEPHFDADQHSLWTRGPILSFSAVNAENLVADPFS